MKIDKCRLCENGNLSEPKLSLPPTPLANEFVKDSLKEQDLFPLEICVCESCGHYQLNESISSERLFRDYLYVAGTSAVNVEHFKQYASHMRELFGLTKKHKVLDIASNDGTLLKHFKDLGMEVLGIDPAENIATEANKNGIPTIPEFFTEVYSEIIAEQYGKFDLVTANNVFAHVPDLADFAKGVKKVLAPDGIFSFEVSYFADVCDKTLFDTVYHEHSSYHTVRPLISFFDNLDMKLFGIEYIPNHGGSIRVFVCNKSYLTTDRSTMYTPAGVFSIYLLASKLERESNIDKQVSYLRENIKLLSKELGEILQNVKRDGKSIAIYGVPAKATTLMYVLGIDEKMIDFAVDDAPLKQGMFTPGKHIPIFHPDEIYKRNPDVLLILGWNFAESIMANHSNFKGKWIVPLPDLKEY